MTASKRLFLFPQTGFHLNNQDALSLRYHLQTLETEESRGMHNHLVLNVQLKLVYLLRFSNLT